MAQLRQMSALRKLQNDLVESEESSDRRIPPASYYIVHLALDASTDYLIEKAKHLLHKKPSHIPIIAYVSKGELFLLYSSIEMGDHFHNGSHQLICSEYVSYFASELKIPVVCRIVEFTERTKILVYFQYKVYEHERRAMFDLSKGKIAKKDLQSLTQTELRSALENRTKIKWDTVPPKERFGVFYKHNPQTSSFITMSEAIDPREFERYKEYMFS